MLSFQICGNKFYCLSEKKNRIDEIQSKILSVMTSLYLFYFLSKAFVKEDRNPHNENYRI